MFTLKQSPLAWLRRALAALSSWHHWQRARWVVLAVAFLSLCWVSTFLPLWQQGIFWVLAVLGAAIALRRARPRLFGPVFGYDLVRTARKGRVFLVRGTYALTLLLILFWVYTSWFIQYGGNVRALLLGGTLRMSATAAFAESFFYTAAAVQFGAVAILTPLYVASALAEEKEKRTLDYLLATDLEDREIILSKLVVRLGHLMFVVLAGLPVLAATEFLGGVDPTLVLGSLVVTAFMMLGLAGLSLLVSVYSRRVIDAVFWTYFWAGVYLFFSWWFSAMAPGLTWFFTGYEPQAVTLGNPFVAIHLLQTTWVTAVDQRRFLFDVLQGYALPHILFTAVCVVWAVHKLRVVALKPEAPKPRWQWSAVEFPPRRRRSKMTGRPLLWKEMHGSLGLGSARFSSFLIYLQLVFGWLMVPMLCIGGASSILATVMLLAVGLYAAGAISGERERQTLDSLLTLPVDSDDILNAKWLGAVLAVRPVWWCLGALWLLELPTGRLNLFAIPLVLAAWWVYAAFVAGLGLCYSLIFPSTLRAAVWTLTTLLGMAVVFRLLGAYGEVFLGPVATFLGELAPFAALDTLHFGWDILDPRKPLRLGEMTASVAALACYAAAAWGLWQMARRRFRALANRNPVRGRAPKEPVLVPAEVA